MYSKQNEKGFNQIIFLWFSLKFYFSIHVKFCSDVRTKSFSRLINVKEQNILEQHNEDFVRS